MRRQIFIWLFLVFLTLVLIIFAWIPTSRVGMKCTAEFHDRNSAKPSSSISVCLRIEKPAHLGQTITFLLTVESKVDAPNARVFLSLPKGVVVVEGDIEKEVDLEKDIPKTFELQAKLLEEGIQEVRAGGQIDFGGGSRQGGFDVLFLDVGKNKTKVYRELPSRVGTQQ